MNTQIAQITQSLAANGCAYITPSDALYDEQDWEPVSYTHLTLPTNREAEITVVAVRLKKKKKNA